MGRFGLCYGPFWLYDGPFWTTQWVVLDNFLGIKIFGAVLVGAILAMDRFCIAPYYWCPFITLTSEVHACLALSVTCCEMHEA